jgi:hypothetical protein
MNMEKSLKLIFGLIGGLALVFINRIFSGHAFLGGVFGFVLHGVMQVLAFLGLIIVELISILLVIDNMKFIFKKS